MLHIKTTPIKEGMQEKKPSETTAHSSKNNIHSKSQKIDLF